MLAWLQRIARQPPVVGPAHHQVADVADERAVDAMHVHPFAVAAANLQAPGHVVATQDRHRAVIGVRTRTQLAGLGVDRLRGVPGPRASCSCGGRPCRRRTAPEDQRDGKDAHDLTRDPVELGVAALERGAIGRGADRPDVRHEERGSAGVPTIPGGAACSGPMPKLSCKSGGVRSPSEYGKPRSPTQL